MFRIVQFANTLTTSYWYVSGAHYKIQDVSIFRSPQHLPTLSGIFTNAFTSTTSSLSFSCNSRSDNETYEIMAALTLQQDLICHSFNENWKKLLKSSIKAKRCSKNWKNLNALRKKLGLYQLLDGSWRGWYQLRQLYHLLSACWVTVANSIRNKTNTFDTKTYLPERVRIRQMTNIRIRLLINKRQMMVI